MKVKLSNEKLNKLGYKLIKSAKSVLFPLNYTCNLCGREIFDNREFCSSCEKSLVNNNGYICSKCGRKTSVSMESCFSCKGEWQVDRARSLYVYTGGGREIIKKYKFSSARYLADIFVPKLYKLYVENNFSCDVILGVPMTEERKYQRSFNQSEYLAKKLGKVLDIKYIEPIAKIKDTISQVGLSIEKRRKNLRQSFVVKDKTVFEGKKVLIVDDVLTTGSTSGELASLLKKKGAKEVYLLTVCATMDKILAKSINLLEEN